MTATKASPCGGYDGHEDLTLRWVYDGHEGLTLRWVYDGHEDLTLRWVYDGHEGHNLRGGMTVTKATTYGGSKEVI